MTRFTYSSGEEIRVGDRITYGHRSGEIEFIVRRANGDPAMDWYLTQFPQGGFMLKVNGVGNFFLHESDEDLVLISRKDSSREIDK